MNRKAILILLALFMVGCGTVASAQTNGSSAQSLGSANIVMVGATMTVVASSGGPGDTSSTPTAIPTSTETQPTTTTPPAMPTTNTNSTSYHTCAGGTGNCNNPWNYVLGCSCGPMYQVVTVAPSGFCTWFQCIANFDNGTGAVAECGDGLMSHSGDLQGACSGHDGWLADLYQYNPSAVTPTPQPTQKPTPSPQPRLSPTPVPSPTA